MSLSVKSLCTVLFENPVIFARARTVPPSQSTALPVERSDAEYVRARSLPLYRI